MKSTTTSSKIRGESINMNFEDPSAIASSSPSLRRREMEEAPAAASPSRRSKYIISHSGPMGSASQQTTAAAYFARVRSKQATNALIRSSSKPEEDQLNQQNCNFNFASVVGKCAPPSSLLRRMGEEEKQNGSLKHPLATLGKVRVVLRVANSHTIEEKSHFAFDSKKRQVTLLDPSSAKNASSCAPKMFAFDHVLTDLDAEGEVCAAALGEAVCGSVAGGQDGCVFSFGHAGLGKTRTMVGSDAEVESIGVIPTAIAWTFRCIAERKSKSNSRFAVRATAAEVTIPEEGVDQEVIRDLLSDMGEGSANPGSLIPTNGQVLQSLTEVRCPTAEKAAQYLDMALSRQSPNSHFVFTLHLYQYSVDSNKGDENEVASRVVGGGRSRLHLIDFGCCERARHHHHQGAISLSSLGHVLLGIFNGQRHLPCKDSPVTMLLKECLGSSRCQATMLAHVSPSPSHYSETLHTAQLASRIHRMRTRGKRVGRGSNGSAGGSGSGSGSDEKHKRGMSSDVTNTTTDPSSSEQSCDTVIYVGRNGGDDEDTDAEHPPVYLPQMNSGDNRGVMARALRGSTAECDKMPLRGRRRASGSGTLERRRSSGDGRQRSPLNTALHNASNMRTRPGSVGGTPTRMAMMQGGLNSPRHLIQQRQQGYYGSLGRGGSLPRSPKGKMPLHGRVAGYRQGGSASTVSRGFSSSGEDNSGECWIDQPQVLQAAARNGNCVVRGYSTNNPGSSRHSDGGDSGVLYGFMDDHKRGMIQQWVECQAAELAVRQRKQQEARARKMVPVKAPPEMSEVEVAEEKPEPFAWLKNGVEAEDPDCKVLAHFRTVESSGSDSSIETKNNGGKAETVSADVHIPPNEEVEELEEDKVDDITSVPPSPAVSSICNPEDTKVNADKNSSSNSPAVNQRSNGHRKVSPSSPPTVEESGDKIDGGAESLIHDGHDSGQRGREEEGRGGERRRVEESISTSGTPPPLPHPLEQPVVPLTSSDCGARNNNDQWRNIHSLDELRRRMGSLRDGCSIDPEELEEEEEYLWVVRQEEQNQPSTSVSNNISETVSVGNDVQQLSTVSEVTEESTTTSEESMDPAKLSTLDGKLLHYVNKANNMGNVNKMCSIETNDDFFERRFDQLSKLHDLYASVSSISAKSQSHLEERQRLTERGSTYSLGALACGNSLDPASSAGDLNSLCSEPVKMPDYFNDVLAGSCSVRSGLAGVGMEMLSRGCCGNDPNNSISLSDLGFFQEKKKKEDVNSSQTSLPPPPPPLATAENEVATRGVVDRSDSPVLEGIDQELAKYAKLKDLKRAYVEGEEKGRERKGEQSHPSTDPLPSPPSPLLPPPPPPTTSTTSGLRRDHVPDGASNPDLNHKIAHCCSTQKTIPTTTKPPPPAPPVRASSSQLETESGTGSRRRQPHPSGSTTSSSSGGHVPIRGVVVPRRSPGTGQSSCSSDPEEITLLPSVLPSSNQRPRQNSSSSLVRHQQQQLHHHLHRASSETEKRRTATVGKKKLPPSTSSSKGSSSFSADPVSISGRNANDRREEDNQKKADVKESLPVPNSPSKAKVPRFSRLIASAKRISRSPLKIGSEKKKPDSKKQKGLSPSSPQQQHPKKQQQHLDKDSSFSPSIVGVTSGKKSASLSSSSSQPGPPPPQGYFTSSSPKNAKGTSSSKGHHHRRKQEQQISESKYSASVLASPYAFPSAPSPRRNRGDTSSNDSGLGGGVVVRLRQGGRGATAKVSNHTQNRRKSNKHCRSSGYESSTVDSLESPTISHNKDVKELVKDESELTLCKELGTLPPLSLVRYQDDDVSRMDGRWRQEQVRLIRCEQAKLKEEMQAAKGRINNTSWSYELHVEKSKLASEVAKEEEEDAFVEAFAKETQILKKRVDACKSHVELVTCFDVDGDAKSKKNSDLKNVGSCCTTECEFAQDIVSQKGDRTETELF